ncbi:hypothetical protein [Pedococcus sp. 5OH_020]|uniref:hypothetical protein n=1 Tax=Pedococcus sp. 5OH_020 TaxID=2989814 RepID=UPI0022E9AA06|nr:hypothetical protein [Pedococcus sp. 5OH_020]
MSDSFGTLPDLVPVLSAGRHRNARKGACFMEMASFLAGERWSDHPTCTHPLLASLARLVNDSLSDDDRPRIAGFIPDVVGLTSADVEIDVAIATRAAAAALPVAPATRQNVLAVGLLTSQRMVATLPSPEPALEELCRTAFACAPQARAWAERYARDARVSERTFRRQTAPHIVSYAVEGIAVACVADPADRLVTLLEDTIRDTATRIRARGERRADMPLEAPVRQ